MTIFFRFLLTVYVYIAFFVWPLTALGHGGEDHADVSTSKIAQSGNKILTYTVTPDTFEVFLKYSPTSKGNITDGRIFISSYRTNIPVDPSSIRILTRSENTTQVTQQPRKISNGVYDFSVQFTGDSSLPFTVKFEAGNSITAELGMLYSQEYAASHFNLFRATKAKENDGYFAWYVGILLVIVALTTIIRYVVKRKNEKIIIK